jgi:hypothetical protein
MSQDRFIADQGEFAESVESGPVLSARDLLVLLGVQGDSDERKRAAVEAWLVDHEPDPILRKALERSGYLPSGKASA